MTEITGPVDRPEVETYAQVESEAFWDAVDALSDRLGPDATADDAIEAFISDRGLTGAVARRVRQELRAEVEAVAADRADNDSLRWMSFGEEFGGPIFGDIPRNGYRPVIDALATDVNVRLNTEWYRWTLRPTVSVPHVRTVRSRRARTR